MEDEEQKKTQLSQYRYSKVHTLFENENEWLKN